jgi:hypothetical protein
VIKHATPGYHETITMLDGVTRRPIRVLLTEDGAFQPLLGFFTSLRFRDRSDAWRRKSAHAVGLLYDFTVAYPPPTGDDEELRGYLSYFLSTLEAGTIDRHTGDDPRGLSGGPRHRRRYRKSPGEPLR